MLLLVAAAVASSAPQSAPDQPVRSVAQATATIRIISGVRLKLNGEASSGAPPPRDSTIRAAAGDQPARLIEFQ
jgi:hypothetical protein